MHEVGDAFAEKTTERRADIRGELPDRIDWPRLVIDDVMVASTDSRLHPKF